jgi:hypothetical protein
MTRFSTIFILMHMNKSILLILVLLPFTMVYSQGNGKAGGFLADAPAVVNPCSMNNEQAADYRNKIADASQVLRDEIDKMDAEADEIAERGDVNVGILKQQGLKDGDAEKIRNEKDMSDAERDALADKALKEKMKMSMDDLNKVVAMNDKGQEKWATASEDEAMANAQFDPDKNQDKQLKRKSSYELADEEKKLAEMLKASGKKYGDMFIQLDKDAAKAMEELKPQLDKLYEDLMHCGHVTAVGEGEDKGGDEKAKAIKKKIDALNENYCNQFTKRYMDILREYKEYLFLTLPDYYRLEELSNQHAKELSGINYNISPTGLLPMKEVDWYMGKLSDVCKYRADKLSAEEQ